MMENLVLFTRAVPAYGGGTCFRHYAKLQFSDTSGKPQEITRKSSDLAEEMLQRHTRLTGHNHEKAWALVKSALKDALNPVKSDLCTPEDQESAFAWLRSDDAADAMELIGIDAEYAAWVVDRLTSRRNQEDEDEQNTCSIDRRVA